MNKKWISLLVAASLSLAMLPTAGAVDYIKSSADNGDTPFVDVLETEWYYNHVTYVYQNELMSGEAVNTFLPEGTLSRAMVVRILYNQEAQKGFPYGSNISTGFLDVPPNQWYTTAVNWAAANGVASGTGNGLFEPNAAITREEFACILYNYAGKPAVERNLTAFSDYNRISSWALPAMKWAVQTGIINGDGQPNGTSLLKPQGTATRSQAAAMIQRFLDPASIIPAQ